MSKLAALPWHDDAGGRTERYLLLSELEAAATVVHRLEAPGDAPCYLAVEVRDQIHVDAILASYASGPGSFFDGDVKVEDPRIFLTRIFHTSGPSANLRELRHTTFGSPGDKGYVFYCPMWAIAKASTLLAEYFDQCEVSA